jgi:hypothetical protein
MRYRYIRILKASENLDHAAIIIGPESFPWFYTDIHKEAIGRRFYFRIYKYAWAFYFRPQFKVIRYF